MSSFFKHKWLMLLVVVTLGFSAYSFVLNAPFKTLDDQFGIVKNEKIQIFDNIGQLFTESYFDDDVYYRPLVLLSYMAEYHFFQLRSVYYYEVNIGIHLLAVIFVFLFIQLLFNNNVMAFFTALLFAMHPVHWVAVTNITGRSVVLGDTFFIASVYCFCLARIKQERAFFYLLSLLSFSCAILTRESTMTLPIILGSYLLIVERRRLLKDFKIYARLLSPYLVVGGIYFFARHVMGITRLFNQHRMTEEIVLSFLTFLRSVITHLRIFIAPYDLHFDRSTVIFSGMAQPAAIATILFFVTLIFLVFIFRKTIPHKAQFFIMWFFILLLPVAQVVAPVAIQKGYISSGEHFLYMPSVAVFVLSVLLMQYMYKKNAEHRWISVVTFNFVILGIIVFLFLTTVKQSIISSSELAMHEQIINYAPHNTRMRYSYGSALVKSRLFAKAEEQFRAILKIDPTDAKVRISLGKALCDQGHYEEGIAEYNKVQNEGEWKSLLEENIRLAKEHLLSESL